MRIRTVSCFVGAMMVLTACGSPEEQAQEAQTTTPDKPATIRALPDPCEWLSPDEAQSMLRLEQPPPPSAMGSPTGAGRTCVYMNADQTRWINLSYQGLNPQVFNPAGRTDEELIELATNMYASGLQHEALSKTDGRPTLTFSDDERTVVIVFTGVGKARDLPEGISAAHAISSYIQATLTLFDPGRSTTERLGLMQGVAEKPIRQLAEVRMGDST